MSQKPLSRRALMAGTAVGAALVAASSADRVIAATTPTPETAMPVPTVPPPNPYPVKPAHQIEAEQLVEYLRLLPWSNSANRYRANDKTWETGTHAIFGRPGHPEEFNALAQCASFIGMMLERAYGTTPATTPPIGATTPPWPSTAYAWADETFWARFGVDPKDPDRHFPTAEQFRAGFANASAIPHIDPVTKPVNLRPGDLVALDYLPNASTTPGGYTGHIVMIRERKGTWEDPAVDIKVGPNVIPYVFEVIDCTSEPHGNPTGTAALDLFRAFPDTRWEETVDAAGRSTWNSYTGVGYGHMIFYADAATKLFAGYRHSVTAPTPWKMNERPIAAARVNHV
ncbi:hypothetical protein GCM10010193_46990 [Kitasatospora atroaurantiaca]|uniref:Secreted protein n=1 Tax=Kitasatospora atroaurantiaca TaxID=285545 RepID=A0A561EZ85_9ACTN|nr:hypothetical protein [Kitasatospora atroaurantiaca]TWE20920.1 hypothetical protein FB465_6080 [Kitasatospora atroaurantiaca]